MKNLHPAIVKEQERWRGYSETVELLNAVLYKVDKVDRDLHTIDGVMRAEIKASLNVVYLTIMVNHTNAMALCLSPLIDRLGPVISEYVKPEEKEFKYVFGEYGNNSRVEVEFWLMGNACKLVQIGEEIIPATTRPIYELQCGGKAVEKEGVE